MGRTYFFLGNGRNNTPSVIPPSHKSLVIGRQMQVSDGHIRQAEVV